ASSAVSGRNASTRWPVSVRCLTKPCKARLAPPEGRLWKTAIRTRANPERRREISPSPVGSLQTQEVAVARRIGLGLHEIGRRYRQELVLLVVYQLDVKADAVQL